MYIVDIFSDSILIINYRPGKVKANLLFFNYNYSTLEACYLTLKKMWASQLLVVYSILFKSENKIFCGFSFQQIFLVILEALTQLYACREREGGEDVR